MAYKATGIGNGRPAVMDLFEKDFKDGMSFEDAAALGLKGLSAAVEEKLKADSVEIGIAEIGKKFRRLSEEEVAELIAKM